MSGKIEVLIVDDSAVVRQALAEILGADPDIHVMGAASDPYIAARKMGMQAPDVMILDVEMPRMDGLTFLRRIMSQKPIPVVICSSLAAAGAETTLRALQYGAVEIIAKPRLGVKGFLEESRVLICDAVKAAAGARLKRRSPVSMPVPPKLDADAILHRQKFPELIGTTEKVVAVGASTGGTEALRVFLEALPHDAPGVVIVQHMPPVFTRAFARRLDGLCRLSVREAKNGDSVLPGRVLIAPGNRHMLLKRSGARYTVEIKDGPLVCRHRPSVDVLFRSASRYAGKNAVGVLMTGMGDDGARGMLEMKQAGAATIAQNEASCVVFGMPGEAIRLGAVDKVLPLEQIAPAVMQECGTARIVRKLRTGQGREKDETERSAADGSPHGAFRTEPENPARSSGRDQAVGENKPEASGVRNPEKPVPVQYPQRNQQSSECHPRLGEADVQQRIRERKGFRHRPDDP